MGYDFAWHVRHGELTDASARKILAILKRAFGFETVLDIGCGDGRWLRQALAHNATSVMGVDGPWTDTSQLLVPSDSVLIADLSGPVELGRRFDMAISLEVAEHLPPDSSAQMVRNLVAHSDLVLFGAAIPFQGGFRHINERWQSEWVKLFDQENYQAFDLVRSRTWSDADIHYWYRQNTLVYINRKRDDLIAQAQRFLVEEKIPELPFDIVHPEKYEAIASYDQIAFKPLLQKLPGKTVDKIGSILRRKN